MQIKLASKRFAFYENFVILANIILYIRGVLRAVWAS